MTKKWHIYACWIMLLGTCTFLSSCSKPATPKEYGYYRIALPQPQYQTSELDPVMKSFPYAFQLSTSAKPVIIPESNEHYWVNINYPSLNATIYCSYKPIRHNLKQLLDDANEFVFSHAIKATAIPEREYHNPIQNVHGMYFSLEGNTATPVQFYLTDSTHHFVRGSVYINCVPNRDSLAPIIDYLQTDVTHMIESFRWTK